MTEKQFCILLIPSLTCDRGIFNRSGAELLGDFSEMESEYGEAYR